MFVPANRSHVTSMVPVADELRRRRFPVCFLCRDAVVNAEYQTASGIDATRYRVVEYTDYYKTDIDRRLPSIRHYIRTRRHVFRFLDKLEFDVLVTCNDDSALFDRLVLEYARHRGCEVLLIQEGVRPAKRRLGMVAQWRETGRSVLTTPILYHGSRLLTSSAFARRGYAHSGCTGIAAAGERFRRQLIAEGVPAVKIRVTGQPRLDRRPPARPQPVQRRPMTEPRVLLFCNQPIPLRHTHLDQLFLDLISVCDQLRNVRLIVKLHPRDTPEEHWRRLVPKGAGRCLQEITRTRPLVDCFSEADGMVTVASTTGIEAMTVGLPVGLIDYLPVSWYLPYAEYGAALSIPRRECLFLCVERLLYDEKLRNSLRGAAEQVIEDELFRLDGQSARRIADLIEEMATARRTKKARS